VHISYSTTQGPYLLISYKRDLLQTRRLLQAFDLKKMGLTMADSRYKSARSSASDWQLCDGRV